MDMNADGENDMVMATFEGTAFLVAGSKEGFDEPKHIVDVKDENVRISLYWDNDKEDYLSVDRSVEGEDNNENHHMTSTAAVDWDEDGDLDLLLGAYEGALYLCINEGTKTEPKFADHNLQVKADGKHLTLEGGLATPRVCDWNQDGLFDILCGGSSGGVFYYKNVGEKGKPKFAAAEALIEKSEGSSPYDLSATPLKDGVPVQPASSFHIEPVDYDNDGDLDLLVGGRCYYASEKKELTKEEEEELSEIKEKMAELNEKMEKLYEGVDDGDQEAMEELFESDDFSKLQEKMMEYWERQDELSPSPQEANLIWLYRNNGGKGAFKPVGPEATE